MRLNKSGNYHKSVLQHLKALFQIVLLVVERKKPYTMGEDFNETMSTKSQADNTRRRSRTKNVVECPFKCHY